MGQAIRKIELFLFVRQLGERRIVQYWSHKWEYFWNMEHMWHSRKSRLAAAATLILLALTCYFCWEILYQERVILNILRMSKDVDDDKVLKALTSDHLEEVVDKWLDAKKREVQKLLCLYFVLKFWMFLHMSIK